MHRISGIITAGTLLVALALPAAAQAATDRNHDRIPDRWERAHHLTLRVNQAKRDQDHDGLVNRSEYLYHTNPRRKDSDRDGVLDGREDADHDGVTNAVEQQRQNRRSGAKPASPVLTQPVGTAPVGAVAAFFDGELVFRQSDGTELVGTVDDATRLMCLPPIQHPTAELCPEERLVPGTRVLLARRTGGHWDLVVLSVAAYDDETDDEDEGEVETDDEPFPLLTPPIAAATAASAGVVMRVGGPVRRIVSG
jgi:hypothetical protein